MLKQGYDENTVWDFPVYSIEMGDLSPAQYDYKPVDIVYHNLDQFNLFYISRGYSEQKDLTASKTFAGDNTQDIVFFLKNTATTCYEGPEIHEPRRIFPHYLQPYHRAGKLNYFSRLLSNMWLGAHGYCTGIRADFQVAVKVRVEVKNATVTSCKIPYISPAFVIPKLRDAAATSNTVDRVPQVPCPNLPYPAAVTDNNLKEANIKIKIWSCFDKKRENREEHEYGLKSVTILREGETKFDVRRYSAQGDYYGHTGRENGLIGASVGDLMEIFVKKSFAGNQPPSIEGLAGLWLCGLGNSMSFMCSPNVTPGEYKPFVPWESSTHYKA